MIERCTTGALPVVQPYYDGLPLLHGREITAHRGHASDIRDRRFHDFRLGDRRIFDYPRRP